MVRRNSEQMVSFYFEQLNKAIVKQADRLIMTVT